MCVKSSLYTCLYIGDWCRWNGWKWFSGRRKRPSSELRKLHILRLWNGDYRSTSHTNFSSCNASLQVILQIFFSSRLAIQFTEMLIVLTMFRPVSLTGPHDCAWKVAGQSLQLRYFRKGEWRTLTVTLDWTIHILQSLYQLMDSTKSAAHSAENGQV
jgi:hypothetical protein